MSDIPQIVLTGLGAGIGAITVALISWWSSRGKTTEETRALYVTASDMVVENLSEEVKRLGQEIRNLHTEIVTLRKMVRTLGGDPFIGSDPDPMQGQMDV